MQLEIISKGKNYPCFFDARDKKKILKHTWYLSNGYACTKIKGKTIRMHRYIMKVPKGVCLDHKNGNRLDNRRSNLRQATPKQNAQNRKKTRGKSLFKGVYRDRNKWHSAIREKGKNITLGRYRSEKTAGRIYDKEALKRWGSFANLNFKNAIPEPEQLKIFKG